MVDISCPWCEEDQPLELATLQEPEADFVCTDCGTHVRFVDAPSLAYEVAA